MQNLFYLFVRYGGFVSFLLLEALCIFLIINFNEKQNRIFLHSASVISGNVAEQFDNLADFLRLQEERDSLAANNARLLAMLGISRFDIALKADTVVNRQDTQRYRYVAAEVINNSTRKSRNFLTLSRGSLHGIKPRMGVIDERGVVGIVRNTSPHFSLVMSVLHPQMRISVRHALSNHEGSMQWEAPLGPDQVNVLYLPRTAPLSSGDTLLTSGYSTHFPPGLPVAVVDTFLVKPGGSTWEVKASLLNDLRNSRYVYVVEDLLAEEQLNLESSNE